MSEKILAVVHKKLIIFLLTKAIDYDIMYTAKEKQKRKKEEKQNEKLKRIENHN